MEDTAPKKNNRLLVIFALLSLVCVGISVVGGILLFNYLNSPEQAKSYVKQSDPIFTEVSGVAETTEESINDVFESSGSMLRSNGTIGSNYANQLEALKKDVDLLIEKSSAAKGALVGNNNLVAKLHNELSDYYTSLNSFAVDFKDDYVSFMLAAIPLYKAAIDYSNELPPNRSPKTIEDYEENNAFYKESTAKIQKQADQLKALTVEAGNSDKFKTSMATFTQELATIFDELTKAFDKLIEASKTKSQVLLLQSNEEKKAAMAKLDPALQKHVEATKEFKSAVLKDYQTIFSELGDLSDAIESELSSLKKQLSL